MGNIRNPRPIYDNGSVMEFFIRDKQTHYRILKCNDEGTNQSLIDSGLLGDQDPITVLKTALQLFSTVSND